MNIINVIDMPVLGWLVEVDQVADGVKENEFVVQGMSAEHHWFIRSVEPGRVLLVGPDKPAFGRLDLTDRRTTRMDAILATRSCEKCRHYTWGSDMVPQHGGTGRWHHPSCTTIRASRASLGNGNGRRP
jgi:hypothetical protein